MFSIGDRVVIAKGTTDGDLVRWGIHAIDSRGRILRNPGTVQRIVTNGVIVLFDHDDLAWAFLNNHIEMFWSAVPTTMDDTRNYLEALQCTP